MRPQVSIVMPVHNAESTLLEAMESCLAQTLQAFELIVVLDGCSDRSEEIARGIDDTRIRVVAGEHRGVVAAAGLGNKLASADLVARMDADDVSQPGRLEAQCAMLRADPGLACVSGRVSLLEPLGAGMQRYVDWVNGLTTSAQITRERFIECPVIQPSAMFRKDVLSYDPSVSWAEDHDLFLRLLAGGARFAKVPEEVLAWRDSGTRLTRTHSAYAEEEVWRMKAHHLARLPGVREHGVAICGAGPIGKRLARLMKSEGAHVRGFFEVNPRRIGEEISGIPVAGPQEFGSRWREAVLLSAVGVEGGRDRVRALARDAGYEEGRNFWCCC